MMKTLSACVCGLSVLAFDAAAQERAWADRQQGRILRVDDSAAPLSHVDFLSVGAAVSAARDGDLILIAPGEYPAVRIAGKSLYLFKDGEGTVTIDWMRIEGLGPEQVVVARGLTLPGSIEVYDCAGAVWIEHCKMLRLRADRDASICLASSTVWGGALAESVAFLGAYDTVLRGWDGSDGWASLDFYPQCDGAPGTDGKPAIDLFDSFAYLSGCDARGGAGGEGDAIGVCCFYSGDGGAGVRVGTRSALLDLSSQLAGGTHQDWYCYYGGEGDAVDGLAVELAGGDALLLPDPARHYEVDAVVRVPSALTLSFDALPGDRPVILRTRTPLFVPGNALGLPNVVPLGSEATELDPLVTGVADVELPAFPIGDAPFGVFFTQAFFKVQNGAAIELVPGPPSVVVVLDEPCHGLPAVPDCNANDVADDCEVALGLSPDADGDGVPDECTTAFTASSGPTLAIGGMPVDLVVPGPAPSGPVRVRIGVRGLSLSGRTVEVALNGIPYQSLFRNAVTDCDAPDAKTFVVDPGIFRAITVDDDARITATLPSIVACADPSITIEVAYPSADVDANGNFVDDGLELTPRNDCDGDGVLDMVQLRRSAGGTGMPFNTYLPLVVVVPAPARSAGDVTIDADVAENRGNVTLWINRTLIASFSGEDCPRRARHRFVVPRDRWNALVGDGDAAVRFTAPAPTVSSCIDSAAMWIQWEDPALDCNGNGRLDACDIAAGTSSDQNRNGVPDECE